MTEIKYKEIKDGLFEIDEDKAGLVPMAGEAEQIAMSSDIRENGQIEPITLWRGKIVDGRCRQKALSMIGILPIKYKELDSSMTDDEVEIYVKSINTRRNLTLTQKLISAAREYIKSKSKSKAKIAQSWGVGSGTLDNAIYILRKRPDLAQGLFDGNSVDIINDKKQEVQSNKITPVYAYVRREVEKVQTEDEEHSWSANSYIKTQVGKEWFYDEMRKRKIKTNVEAQKILAEMANYKFKLPELG